LCLSRRYWGQYSRS